MEQKTQEEVVTIVDFNGQEHLPELALCLMNLRNGGGDYPPKRDCENKASELTEWLMSEEPIYRYVALVDGEVAGHISLVAPHDYISHNLEALGIQTESENGFIEISKFFVSPNHQRHGIGQKLFEKVTDVAQDNGYTPALAVVDTSTKAVTFYQHHGMKLVCEFDGIHGKNFIFI